MSIRITNGFQVFNVYFYEIEAILLAQDMSQYSFLVWSSPKDIRELTLTVDDFRNKQHKFYHYGIGVDEDKHEYFISANCSAKSLEELIELLQDPKSPYKLHTNIITDGPNGDITYKLGESALPRLDKNKYFTHLTFFRFRPESRFLVNNSNDVRPYQVSSRTTETTEEISKLKEHFSHHAHLINYDISTNSVPFIDRKEIAKIIQRLILEELEVVIEDDSALINIIQDIRTIPRRLEHIMAPDDYFHIDRKPRKAHILRGIRRVFRGRRNKELEPENVELLVDIIDNLSENDLLISENARPSTFGIERPKSPGQVNTNPPSNSRKSVRWNDDVQIRPNSAQSLQDSSENQTEHSPVRNREEQPNSAPNSIDQVQNESLDESSNRSRPVVNVENSSIEYASTLSSLIQPPRDASKMDAAPYYSIMRPNDLRDETANRLIYQPPQNRTTTPIIHSNSNDNTIPNNSTSPRGGAKMPDNCEIRYESLFGGGYFADVYKARINESIFAVKVIKSIVQGFDIREAQTLLGVIHPNIVKLYGVLMMPDVDTKLIFEFMEGGCLEAHLKSGIHIAMDRMRSWAQQVAYGMRYFEENKLVHRDLAARNILLNHSKEVVKIGDFGLARYINSDGYYPMASQFCIPARWQSIEVIKDMMEGGNVNFTIKNDCWSFGVLLYEIYSRGKKPYEDKPDNIKIYQYLVSNDRINRLERPVNTPDNIYKLMVECWDTAPEKRPSFKDIFERLGRS